MKKILFSIALVCLFLVGCEPYGVIEEGTVVGKEKDKYGNKYIIVEKEGEQVKLEVRYAIYRATTKGQTVDIEFDRGFYVTNLKFSNMEKDVDKDKE